MTEQITTAMLLAAGRGARMKPLTNHLPKPLVEVDGRPLIEWHLAKLQSAGIDKVVINVAHLADQIIKTLGDGHRFGLTIVYSQERDGGLETAGGIIKALPLLGDKPFLVINADVWIDVDFVHMANHKLGNFLVHLLLVDTPDFKSRGDFYLDHSGRVNVERKGELLTFSGVSVICAELFASYIDCYKDKSLALLQVLEAAMGNDRVSGEYFVGEWEDIGTIDRLEALNRRLVAKQS